MNTIRNLLVSIAVVLGAAVVGVDHYMTNVYLREFVETRTYHSEQLVKILAAEDSARLANNLSSVVHLQGTRVAELEGRITRLLEVIEALKIEVKTREAVIKASAEQIDDLSKGTTELQKEYDDMDVELRKSKDMIDAAKKEIERLTKELKAAEAKIKELTPKPAPTPPAPMPTPAPAIDPAPQTTAT